VSPRLGRGGTIVIIFILVLVAVVAWAGSSPLAVVDLLIGSGVLATWVYGRSPQAGSAPAQA
jgi:hypothetical protein